jgi:hypothetical protein
VQRVSKGVGPVTSPRYMKVDRQYGVQLRGETFVRLQPSLQTALIRAETTPGTTLLVHSPETGKWETYTPTFEQMYGGSE